MPPKLKESEKLLHQLNAKKTIADRLIAQSAEVLQSQQTRKVIRHKEQLEEKTTECIKLLSMIQEMKLTEGENEEETMTWTTAEEKKHQDWDNKIEELDNRIKQLRKNEEQERIKEEIAVEDQRRTKQREEEDNWIEKQRKFHMDLEEKKLEQLKAQQLKAKLPKLQLSKFDGTITDWVRFWEQFVEEIDKSTNYAAITKFSYLRELLTSQPKTEITGLPFTEEGYNTAKKLLQQKYGQTTEVIYAHGQQITSLPTITSTSNLSSIHQFYRKLNVSINSLKTLGKLDTAEIMVRQTLDKLGPIKTDIIRTEPNWQQWNFERLLEELREYTIRNPETKDQNQRHQEHRSRHHDNHRNGHGRTSGYQATNKDSRKSTCIASTAMTNPTEAATATKYRTSKRGRRFSNERSYATTALEATTTYPTVKAEAVSVVINAITHQSAI